MEIFFLLKFTKKWMMKRIYNASFENILTIILVFVMGMNVQSALVFNGNYSP